MDIAILGAMVMLIGLFAWFILTQRSGRAHSRVDDGQLKEQFLVFKEVGEAIQKLTQQQEEAQRLGQSLKDLLQAPKLRGTYGEVILEEMLDRVLPKGIWERQYSISGGEKVDCVVKFRDVAVPIDAKFPRDDYMRYMDAESVEDRATHWRAFEEEVRKQIADIQTKYIQPENGTSEFALMFIPSEVIYYEAIAEKNYLGSHPGYWSMPRTTMSSRLALTPFTHSSR